ncbi:hypothetical protein F7725_020200 [Dissostichus mawsoni]|uniref:Uncharacterized protein n=1 Tax=Dissostichus mawsoni TaxID=36200 RepID=A0A7J5YCJ0_DISMA|nr:hypothetical protein F7725_020200 [Dissostichus mawsoni]
MGKEEFVGEYVEGCTLIEEEEESIPSFMLSITLSAVLKPITKSLSLTSSTITCDLMNPGTYSRPLLFCRTITSVTSILSRSVLPPISVFPMRSFTSQDFIIVAGVPHQTSFLCLYVFIRCGLLFFSRLLLLPISSQCLVCVRCALLLLPSLCSRVTFISGLIILPWSLNYAQEKARRKT